MKNWAGVWSIAHVNRKYVSVFFKFFVATLHVFYHSAKDRVVVGNSAQLVSLFRNNELQKRINWRSLSWMASTTMVWGNETVYEGVQKITPGDHLIIAQNSITPKISTFPTNYFTPLGEDILEDTDRYLELSVNRICDRVAWYLNRGINLTAHLTGGKDTRAILALLLGSGHIK